ncbi:MAG: nitroreductase family protein [Prolixibacteraceae bacterium]|nr:nitroreductase family protein [Prolixibacteraceae bacterium]
MQLNKAIKNRWSPRVFSDKPVTNEMIQLLFEAASKAPSSRNEQPWSYYYAHRKNSTEFNQLVELLTGNNPLWAKDSQLLIISVLKKNFEYKNRYNGKALHDVGAANISIGIQAAEMGLQAHPMGGFDKEKATEFLKLDSENFEPVIMIAVGFPDETKPFSEETLQRIDQHQSRKDIKEFVFQLK